MSDELDLRRARLDVAGVEIDGWRATIGEHEVVDHGREGALRKLIAELHENDD